MNNLVTITIENAPPLREETLKGSKIPVVSTPLTDYQLTTKNYYTWSQTAVFCHFHYSSRKTVSLEEIRKSA